MRIGILLGSAGISGGTYVIYEHASRLKARGHQVTMITRDPVAPDVYTWHPAASSLRWQSVAEAKKPRFDVIVATWWQSVFLLHEFNAARAVYFVQSIESRFFAPENPADHDTRDNSVWMQLCESTYSYNIPMLTEARWIRKYLYENFNRQAWLVPNGIRKDIYRPDGGSEAPRKKNRLRVLIEGPVNVFYKNVPKSVELCRKAGVGEVWLMTSSPVSDYPGVDRVFSQVPVERTAAIYRSCDLLLKLSYVEGMFGPPLEMFHCGGTAVVYDVTGHDEYIRHGENAYVVRRDDDRRVIEMLQRLLNDAEELERLKGGALETAAAWPDWETASAQFEAALQEICEQTRPVSRKYLESHTRQAWENNQNRLDARELHFFSCREAETQEKRLDDFVQVYWHTGEGFSQEKFKWGHTSGEGWGVTSVEISPEKDAFHLRIDPSVRIGIVQIKRVRVLSGSGGETLFFANSRKSWRKIALAGTARWLKITNGYCLLASFGNDPQLILPVIRKSAGEAIVRVEIEHRCIGYARAFKLFSRDLLSLFKGLKRR